MHIAVDERDISSLVLHREMTVSWFERVPKRMRLRPRVLLKCCELEYRRFMVLSFFRFRWHTYQQTRFGEYPQYRIGRDQWQALPQNEAMRESPAWTEFFEALIDEYYAGDFESARKKVNIKLWAVQSLWWDYEYEEFDPSYVWDSSEIRTLTPVPPKVDGWKWRGWNLNREAPRISP
jgi:hypothetical protein